MAAAVIVPVSGIWIARIENAVEQIGFVAGQYREHQRMLAGFAERPAIYTTPLFRELLEDKARANITRALARWRHAA